MTKEELAQSVKNKYPQYNDIDNSELAEMVLAEFPVYRAQIKEEKGTFRKIGDFFTGVKEDISKRSEAVGGILDRPQALPSKALQFAGQATGLGLDIAGRATSALTPDVIEEPITEAVGSGVEKILGTKVGRKGIEAYQKFKQENPEVAGNLEAILNLSVVAPVAPLGKAGQVALQKAARKGGRFVKEVGEEAVGLTRKAKKLQPVIKEKIEKKAYDRLTDVSRKMTKMSQASALARSEAKWNKNTPKFLVDEGVVNLIDVDGNKIATQEALDALREKYRAEANAFQRVLKDSGDYVSLNNFEKSILNELKDMKTRGSDYRKSINYVKQELKDYKDNFSNIGIRQDDDLLLSVDQFNKIKSGLWARTSNFNPSMQDKLLSDVNYRMGQVAKEFIENEIDDAGIRGMNSRLGDFLSAMKVLEKADGKSFPGGFFGKQFVKIAGTIAGVKGGVVGAIMGNITAGALADLALNPKIKTALLSKLTKRLQKTEKGRSIMDEAEEILRRRGEERASRKLLDSPKFTPAKAKIDTSRVLTQEEARMLLKEIGVFDTKIEEQIKLLPAAGESTKRKIDLPAETDTTIEKRGAVRRIN
jgi:hypothetical protein